MPELAINGGEKVRTKPWSKWPVWDEQEIKALEEVVRSGHWGRLYEDSRVEQFEKAFAAYQDARFGGLPRDRFIQALNAEGIPTGGGYSHPLYKNPLFTERRFGRIAEFVHFPDYRAVHCPNCERLCQERVSISQTCLLGTAEDMCDIAHAVEKIRENVDELRL